MKKFQLFEHQLKPGETLSWHIFNGEDQLLLRKGTVVGSEAQIKSLIARGAWYSPDADVKDSRKDLIDDTQGPVFEQLHRLIVALEGALSAIKQQQPQGVSQVDKLATRLQVLYEREADALIGAVHLLHEYDYSIMHSVHVAIITLALLPTIDADDEEKKHIVCAALTCNLTLFPLQNFLQKQADPLNDKQQQAISLHPTAATNLLKMAGVDSTTWLDVVAQHHERLDGSGYPAGLDHEAICLGAKLVAVADRYSAMVAKRAYRSPLAATKSLRTFFEKRGQRYDEKLSIHLVKQMGMYPPGACVTLANGETAIVVQRNSDPQKPIARAYINPQGRPYSDPFTRRCGSEKNYVIKACVTPSEKIPLNLTKIWGYKR